jgi:hypothetical protein
LAPREALDHFNQLLAQHLAMPALHRRGDMLREMKRLTWP